MNYAKLKRHEVDLEKQVEKNLFDIARADTLEKQEQVKKLLKKSMRELSDVRKKLLDLLTVK